MNESNFQEQYSASPQKIQDFLISEELTEITKNIVVLAKLGINQTTQLTEMIGNVLIGKISPEDFSQEIESNLKVSPSQARIIIELANKKIFKPFSGELEQYKSRPSFPERQKPSEFQEPRKTATFSQETPEKHPIKEDRPKQIPSEQIIPEYSFPEPSEVKVEKPVSKIGELKKVVSPKVSPEQQKRIREKLLNVMQKKDTQPKIVEEMKKVSLRKSASKEEEEKEEEKLQREKMRKKTETIISSEVLGGEGKKFQAEEGLPETKKEKPYILDVKLKEEPSVAPAVAESLAGKKAMEGKQEKAPQEEPIPYRKYQKKSPFGKA